MINQSAVRDLLVPTIARAKNRPCEGKVAFIVELSGWFKGVKDSSLTADDESIVSAKETDTYWVAVTTQAEAIKEWSAAEAVVTGDLRKSSGGIVLVALSDRTTGAALDDTELAEWGLASGDTGEYTITYNSGHYIEAGTNFSYQGVAGGVTPTVTGTLPLSTSLSVLNELGFRFELNGVKCDDEMTFNPDGTANFNDIDLEEGDVITVMEPKAGDSASFNVVIQNGTDKMTLVSETNAVLDSSNKGNNLITFTTSVSVAVGVSGIEVGNFWTIKSDSASPVAIALNGHVLSTGTNGNVPEYGAVTVVVREINGAVMTLEVIGGIS